MGAAPGPGGCRGDVAPRVWAASSAALCHSQLFSSVEASRLILPKAPLWRWVFSCVEKSPFLTLEALASGALPLPSARGGLRRPPAPRGRRCGQTAALGARAVSPRGGGASASSLAACPGRHGARLGVLRGPGDTPRERPSGAAHTHSVSSAVHTHREPVNAEPSSRSNCFGKLQLAPSFGVGRP